MATLSFEQFLANHRRQVEAIFDESGAGKWSVALETFAQAVWHAAASAGAVESGAASRLLGTLRSPDLALALGCAQGNESAWDTFCAEYRPVLYDAARAFVREESQARELADSLLAELYGVDASGGSRHSKFVYFHGRSSLKTWLRAVLYQKFVDEYRRQSRNAPLPKDSSGYRAAESSVSEQDDRRYADCLSEAVEAALCELEAGERLILSYYYVEQLTLKQIGGLTGEHEATISRRLDALRKKLRKRIERHLRTVRKLSAYEMDRCLDFATRGVTVDLEKVLRPE